MHITDMEVDVIADYLNDTPRTGRTVRLYLDGTAKPHTFPASVATRFIGAMLRIEGRKVFLDAADLDELYDAIVEAADGATHGQRLTLAAIAKQVAMIMMTDNNEGAKQ